VVSEAISSFLGELAAAVLDPTRRLFWGYLLAGGVIGLGWLIAFRGRSLRQGLAQIFDRTAWLSASARADYRLMAINTAFMLLVSPRLLSQLGVSVLMFEWLHGAFDGRPHLGAGWPDWLVAAVFTSSLFVVDDFARYVVHRLMHRVPVLWSFHKVHHSATSLNPFTVYRIHPVEGVLFVLRSSLVNGTCIAAFVFFFGERVTLATVLGASVLSFAFNALCANLRHSPVPMGFWRPLEVVFISPAQHQVHHSVHRRHVDKNFGVALALWDVLFGTHCFSEPEGRLRFGIDGDAGPRPHTLSSLYWGPVRECLERLQGFRGSADPRPHS
jgi:sterol desaturase/sphingolipid hydroxylase (fatty acid hydroxylase superfamily)